MLVSEPRIRVQSFLKGEDMARRRGQRGGFLREHHGLWLLTYRVYDQAGTPHRETVTIGPAEGKEKLTKKQADRVAWDHYLSKVDRVVQEPRSMLTVDEYWMQYFKPAAELFLKKSAREQYFSLYKCWVKDVIGSKRLSNLIPSDIEQAMARSKAGKKSSETAKHIRKLIRSIWNRAKKTDKFVSGDNPATSAGVPDDVPVRRKIALSAEQVFIALRMLPEPLRSMVLMAVLTSANISELCGLQWKHINLTPAWIILDEEGLEPFMIAIRQHFNRGELGTLKADARRRNIPITKDLLAALAQLKQRPRFTGPEDFVFCTRRGTPINENNID